MPEQSANSRTEWECCGSQYSASTGESAIRALAKHLEEDHGMPREAIAKFLQADADVRDYDRTVDSAGKVRKEVEQ